MVDMIPLVYYIPPPPDVPTTEIQIPETVYSYPPKPPVKADKPPKKLFRFIKFKKSSNSEKKSADTAGSNAGSKRLLAAESGSWEDTWDTEGYPSVILGENRAACAICLLDFEEPKRLHPGPEAKAKAPEVTSQAVEVISEEARENDELRLTDAGEGAQPLRLLRCSHVFHVGVFSSYLLCILTLLRKLVWTRG